MTTPVAPALLPPPPSPLTEGDGRLPALERELERGDLWLFVIYENPSDFPGLFVVRRWLLTQPDAEPWFVGSTLGAARESLPLGLYNLGRQPGDDHTIKEVWI